MKSALGDFRSPAFSEMLTTTEGVLFVAIAHLQKVSFGATYNN